MNLQTIHIDQRIIRGVVAGILFMVLILSFVFDPSTYKLIDCAFNNLTGLPCPSCGLTRSFYAMAHMHFAEAFGLNWMGPLLFLGVFGFAVLFFAEAISGRSFQFWSNIFSPKVLFLAWLGLWLVVWVGKIFVISAH